MSKTRPKVKIKVLYIWSYEYAWNKSNEKYDCKFPFIQTKLLSRVSKSKCTWKAFLKRRFTLQFWTEYKKSMVLTEEMHQEFLNINSINLIFHKMKRCILDLKTENNICDSFYSEDTFIRFSSRKISSLNFK